MRRLTIRQERDEYGDQQPEQPLHHKEEQPHDADSFDPNLNLHQ